MMGADVLLGGVGGFGKLYPLQNGLFWTDWFWCTQFTVIYKSAYESILQADFKETDVADEFLSKLFSNKMVIGPFISKQVDFGYSDVTRENNQKVRYRRILHWPKSECRSFIPCYMVWIFAIIWVCMTSIWFPIIYVRPVLRH